MLASYSWRFCTTSLVAYTQNPIRSIEAVCYSSPTRLNTEVSMITNAVTPYLYSEVRMLAVIP